MSSYARVVARFFLTPQQGETLSRRRAELGLKSFDDLIQIVVNDYLETLPEVD